MLHPNSDPKKESTDKQTAALGARVEDPDDILLRAAQENADELAPTTNNGQPLDYRMNKGHDSRGSFYRRNEQAYDWERDTYVGPTRQHGWDLATEEKALAEREDEARRRAEALAAHDAGLERGKSARAHVEHTERPRTGYEATTGFDPREALDAETLAKVNQSAADMAERFDAPDGRAAFSRAIAREVFDGGTVLDAVVSIRESLDARPSIGPEPLADLHQDQWDINVTVTVNKLFEQPAPNQYQSGYFKDEAGDTMKFVYWNKSKKSAGMPTLREGDHLRITGLSAKEYNDVVSLAVTGHTEISVLDRGDGPAHFQATQRIEPTTAHFSAESDKHAWAIQNDHPLGDSDPAISDTRIEAVNRWVLGGLDPDDIDEYVAMFE